MSTTLTVTGMTCEHCEQRITDALAGVDGVGDATTDHETKRATVEGDADTNVPVAAVEDVGYDASA